MEQNGIAPTIAAHRGWHMDGAPKNSIAALERAVAGGVDSVEIDVRRLADGTLVVHHDATLPDGRVLAQVDAGALAAHPHVPTLDDWAKRAGELGANALVELKESGYEDDVVATLRRHLAPEQLEFFSFRPSAVRAVRRIVPDRPVGLLSDLQSPARTGAQLVREGLDANATFLGLNVRQTQDDVLRAISLHDFGVKVWTVDAPADMARLARDARIDTIISDRPDLALAARDAARRALLDVDLARAGIGIDDVATTLQRFAATIR